jgi:hypothetical protein
MASLGTVIFLSALAFVKYFAPSDVDKEEWTKLDLKLKNRLAPLHQSLGRE